MTRTSRVDRRLAETTRTVSEWMARDWARWLRSVYRHGDTYPLRLSSNADPLNELEEIYEHSHERTRTAIRDGVVKTLHEWDLRYHGYGMLRWLSFAAARLRASDAIPQLVDILVRNREQLRHAEGDFFNVADDVLAVLAGFAPDPVIEKVFNALLFDDSISPRLTGLLALGVSMSNRKQFARAFDRFVERKKLAPDFFDDGEIVRAYAQFMSPRGLIDEARTLQAAGQDYVYNIAGDIDLVDPEVFIGWDGGESRTARHGDVAEFDDRNQSRHLSVRYHAARLGIERRIRKGRSASKKQARKPLPESFGQLALDDMYQRAAAMGARGEV